LSNFIPVSLHVLAVVEHTFNAVALCIVLLAVWVTLVQCGQYYYCYYYYIIIILRQEHVSHEFRF